MFQEIWLIIFDRRHIKDVRIWTLIVLVLAEVGSFYAYHKYIVSPRFERQGRKIKQIIEVGRFKAKIDALPRESDHELH